MSVRLSAKSSSYTDEMAQDAIGTILLDSAQINFTYDDVTPNITATIIADSINDTHIDWGVGANQVSADDVPDGATNAIITLTQETNFETAYTHSQDNTQAHSDYLLNNADDIMTGILTCDGLKTGDNEKVQLGTGLDFDLYHDGTDCKVDINTGDLDWTHPAQVSWTLDADFATTGTPVHLFTTSATAGLNASSGEQIFASFAPRLEQSGTASVCGFEVKIDTAGGTGSGTSRVMRFMYGNPPVNIILAGVDGAFASMPAGGYFQAKEIRATGDLGGAASTVSMTNTVLGAAGGAVTINRNTAGTTTNAGWLKFYNGTTAYGMPMVLWTNL